MTRPREVITYSRPVCQNERGGRCRKTAVVSIDGVWLCPTHADPATNDYARQFGRMFSVPIRWVRDAASARQQ